MKVMKDSGNFSPRDNAIRTQPSPDEVRQIFELIKQGLKDGALGIGYGINYLPKATHTEILDHFRLAAEHK